MCICHESLQVCVLDDKDDLCRKEMMLCLSANQIYLHFVPHGLPPLVTGEDDRWGGSFCCLSKVLSLLTLYLLFLTLTLFFFGPTVGMKPGPVVSGRPSFPLMWVLRSQQLCTYLCRPVGVRSSTSMISVIMLTRVLDTRTQRRHTTG